VLFGEAIGIAIQSLRANKLRSLLTVLGILIGVSSVIAVVAITEGLDRYMSDKVLELGTRAFHSSSGPTSSPPTRSGWRCRSASA